MIRRKLAVILVFFSYVLLLVTITHAQEEAAHVLVGPNLRASNNVKKGGRNECWISASRTKANFLVGVSQTTSTPNADDADQWVAELTGRRCATFISKNGGQTWREVPLPKQAAGCFDTMTASAPDGRIYVSQPTVGQNFGLGAESTTQPAKGTIRIYSTADEGKTWQGFSELSCPVPPDHPRMVVDDSEGPHRGRLYVEWNEVIDSVFADQFHLFLQYSDNNGQSFSEPTMVTTAISKGGKLVATEPVVLSDGSLLVTYYQYWNPLSDPKNNSQPSYVVRSTDGGKTLGAPLQITTVGPSAWLHLRGDFARAFALPIVTADTSATSPHRDNIYIVWQDIRNGGAADIWLVKSTDKGLTWSKPMRLNDNPPARQDGPLDYRVTPVVAVNRDGVVAVAWYDYRDDPSHVCWRQYFTASTNGGETFLPNVAVSDQPSCPAKGALEPSVRVWNTSPPADDTLPSTEEIANAAAKMDRYQLEQELSLGQAIRAEEEKVGQSKIDITFDYDRNLWPGHYTGMTADVNGVFHVLWSDRRNAPLQQIFTATVKVARGLEVPPRSMQETDVTKLVRLTGDAAAYRAETHEVSFELQIRNTSDRIIYGPLRVQIVGVDSVSGKPTAVIVNPDSGPKTGLVWDFSRLLGSSNQLGPGMVSEAKKVTVRTSEGTGLDGVLRFKVTGHVVEGAATSSRSALRK